MVISIHTKRLSPHLRFVFALRNISRNPILKIGHCIAVVSHLI